MDEEFECERDGSICVTRVQRMLDGKSPMLAIDRTIHMHEGSTITGKTYPETQRILYDKE